LTTQKNKHQRLSSDSGGDSQGSVHLNLNLGPGLLCGGGGGIKGLAGLLETTANGLRTEKGFFKKIF